MPRGTKKSANQHSHRHENGIVAPGKRITKQRSNGQLRDGPSDTNPFQPPNHTSVPLHSDDSSTRVTTPPLPSPPPGQHAAELRSLPLATANGRLGPPSKERSSSASLSQPSAQVSTVGDGKLDNAAVMDGGKTKASEGSARRSEVNAIRPAATQDSGTIQHIGTLVSSRSLADSLTVLVFLLSLPSSFHVVVNALFALTTFVPPAGTFSNLPTLSDFVSSSSPTTPSFAVVVLIDSMSLILWHFLPLAFQALFIDSAQAIVATTLGGGYSNKPGSPDNTLWCLGFATISHFMTRYKRSIYRILHRTWIGRWTPQFEMIEERSLTQDYPVGYERRWADTIQVFLALHIVCQGLTKMVRRSLYTSRLSTTSTILGSGREVEVASASTTGVETGEGLEHPRHGAQLRSKESLANLRDVNRDKVSSGKRRRKQGNYTRSQQPLWAAFASTKASMAREYLANDAKKDMIGTGAVDLENLGDAPFETVKNKVFVTRTQSNSIFFETGPMDPSRSSGQRKEGDEEGVDRTRPFYVRVNGADWISTKLMPIPDTDDKGRMQWVGQIYGLTPANSYHVQFIRCDDDTEMHSETIVTLTAKTTDQALNVNAGAYPVLPLPPSPASPTATLKVSIESCETNVEALLEKQRRFRKESRAAQSNIRKEIDSLNDKISKQASGVQSIQARQSKENQHIRQAEDAIVIIAEELDTWKEIPEDEIEAYKLAKGEHEATRNELRDAKNELVRTKEQNQRTLHTMQEQANSAEAKTSKTEQRLNRLKSQVEKLKNPDQTSPSQTGVDPLDTQRSDSSSSVTRQQQRAARVQGWTNMLEGRERVLHNKLTEFQLKSQELQYLRNLDPQVHRPRTPSEDGQLPGTMPLPPSTGNARPYFDRLSNHGAANSNPFGTPDRSSHHLFESMSPSPALLHKTHSTGGHGKTKPHSSSFGNVRPRSTSIMSGNTVYQDTEEGSGGTDVTAFEPLSTGPFSHPSSTWAKRRSGGIGLVREGSNGGSSGSGSGSPRVLGGITRPPARESSWNAS